MSSFAYWTGFAWGLAVALSFVGWGACASRLAGVAEEDRDWALCACWGVAVVVAFSGVLALFSLANAPVLIAIGIAGCCLAVLCFRPPKAHWELGAALVFAITLLLWYAPSVASRSVEPYDDYLAYFAFARRFLDSGTLIEPFSFRRLLSYGGQSLLHALTISVGSDKGMHILDSGICMLILGGLTYRALRTSIGSLWAVLGSAVVLLVPLSRHNTMSEAMGLVLWIALFRTIQVRSTILTGLLLAALCSLRSTHIVVAAVLVAGLMVAALGRSRFLKNARKTEFGAKQFLTPSVRAAPFAPLSLAECGRIVAVACAASASWAMLLYRSSGSLVYPLFKGYQTPGMSVAFDTPWAEQAQAVLHFMLDINVLFLLVPLILATFAVRGLHAPFCAAAIVLMIAVSWAAPLTDTLGLFQYVQPFGWGSLLIAGGALMQNRKLGVILAILMAPMWVGYMLVSVTRLTASVHSIPAEIADRAPMFPIERIAEYRRLESAMPAGAAVFAIVPLPSLLDYRSHRVLNADFIGFASLPPGLPFFRGSPELKKYLVSSGVEYIAYNDFDHPAIETGYWRDWWKERASKVKPEFAPLVPYVLDMMKNVDELAATEETVVKSGDLRLIRLTNISAGVASSRIRP